MVREVERGRGRSGERRARVSVLITNIFFSFLFYSDGF